MPKKSRKKPRGTHFDSRKKRKLLPKIEGSNVNRQDVNPALHKSVESSSRGEEFQVETREEPIAIKKESEDVTEFVSGESNYPIEPEMCTPAFENVLPEHETVIPENVGQYDDGDFPMESEPMEADSETSVACEIQGIEDIANVTSTIKTVSDVIVVDNINDRLNTKRPWVSLKDPTLEDGFDPLSPTSVTVVPGPFLDSFSRDSAPVLNMDHPSSSQAFHDASSTVGEFDWHDSTPPPSETLPPSDGRGGGTPDLSTRLLSEVRDFLLLLLPPRWIPIVLHSGIHVGLLADLKPTLIQRSLFFSPDGTVSTSVNGKELPADHQFWQLLSKIELNEDTTKRFSEFILRTVSHFRSYVICKGVEEFGHLWKESENVEIDHNRFHETRFKITCRSVECSMLVPSLKTKRCGNCQTLWKSLSKRSKAREGNENTLRSKKPLKYLNTPQKNIRIDMKNKEIRRLRAANERHKKKLSELIRNEGISVDDKTSQDFIDILTDDKHKASLTDFQQLFTSEQITASSVKSVSGM